MRLSYLLFASMLLPFAVQAKVPDDVSSQAQVTKVDTATCGSTVDDNLDAARHALGSNDKTMRQALVCLIGATSNLNRRLSSVSPEKQQPGVMYVPVSSLPVYPAKP